MQMRQYDMKQAYTFEQTEPEVLRQRIEAKSLAENMCSLLDARADQFPQRRAWYFFERGEDLAYRDVRDNVNRAADALRKLGVRKGSHVAVMSPNCGAFLTAWLAIARLGAVIVPINTRYTPREVKYVVED
ncbi:MAG: AMP-binding protein, partial [Hyphomicrobiales bacterium]